MSAVEPSGDAPQPAEQGSGARIGKPASEDESREGDVPMRSFDGVAVERLRAELRVPELHLYASTTSTLDVAHRLGAAGSPHGTLVIADQQTQGRGRAGKSWSSPPGTGLWITMLARPVAAAIPQVMTVRLGLAAAKVLDRFAPTPVRIKWPNDLYVGDRKLAGVLVEARWHGSSPEWLAVGIGVNVSSSAHAARTAALGPSARRVAVLQALLPTLRSVIDRADTMLDDAEVAAYDARDLARGAACTEPRRGVVRGITSAAELLIATDAGMVTVNAGSLVLAEGS